MTLAEINYHSMSNRIGSMPPTNKNRHSMQTVCKLYNNYVKLFYPAAIFFIYLFIYLFLLFFFAGFSGQL